MDLKGTTSTWDKSKPKKNAFLDMPFVEEVNVRENKDFSLFENYQVNPYSLASFEFVTPKIGERPPKLDPKTIPGYQQIKEAMSLSPASVQSSPTQKYCEPQTTNQRYGWFIKHGPGSLKQENTDERFRFSHRTADFIKEKAQMKAYDKTMGNISSKGKAIPRSSAAN